MTQYYYSMMILAELIKVSFRSRMAIKENFLVGQQSLSNTLLILFSITSFDGSVRGRDKNNFCSSYMHA